MLSDRDQIANVLARYTFAVDDGDVDAWRALFVPQAVMRVGTTVMEGLEAVETGIAGAFGAGRHANLTSVIEVDPGGQDATAQTDFFFAWRDESGAYSLQTTPGPHFGRYRDRLVKVGAEWRFAERDITVYADLG